jgi:hypothetical protein
MSSPAIILPALGAAAVAGAYEWSEGHGVDQASVAMVGSATAVALGLTIAAEEGDLVYGPILAGVGALALVMLLQRR